MGYEITFHYHERLEETGKYDMDNQKSFAKKVGQRSAEIPLESVAAVVLGQLARRDIWIVNVEIFEYVKREVNFKETKTGVTIKNRKFHYDQIGGSLIGEDEEAAPQAPQIQQKSAKVHIPNSGPLRSELFRPNREDYPVLQRQGLKLTMGKAYPIFEEKVRSEMEPIYYVTNDDSGSRVELSSLFFEPVPRGLVGPQPQLQHQHQDNSAKLAYIDYNTAGVQFGGGGGPVSGDMPVLRRGF